MLEENKSNKNVVILVIAVIVLVAIAYFLTKGYSSQRQNTVAPQEGPQITKENVVVKNTNLGAAGTAESKLPEGFPSGIPVETAGVMESYSAVYQDRGLTQYAVSFTTDKSVVAVFGEYDLYMKINKEWHLKNKMPSKPTLEDRLKWHLEHSKNCTCRKMPILIRREIIERNLLYK